MEKQTVEKVQLTGITHINWKGSIGGFKKKNFPNFPSRIFENERAIGPYQGKEF